MNFGARTSLHANPPTYASLGNTRSLPLKNIAWSVYEDIRMQYEDTAKLNLKRPANEQTEPVKKVKLEVKTEDLEDEVAQVRNKPLTRGVERVSPYPTECRPSQLYYDWHRRQLVKDVTERLASQGRRVVGLPRFLDDGIVFDWIYDKSILLQKADVSIISAPNQAQHSTVTQVHAFDKKCAKPMPEETRSLKTDLTGSILESTQLAQGSLDNPVVISDEESVQCEEGVDGDIVSSSDSESTDLNSDTDDTTSELPIDSHPVNVEVNTSTHSSSTVKADSRLYSQTYSFSQEGNHFDALSGVIDGEADIDERTASNRSVRGREDSLRKINWQNYQSILIFKRLPRTTSVEDVYAFLLKHGITFQSVKEIIIHYPERGGTLASIEFHSSASVQEAMTKLCNAIWQPSSSCSSNTLKIEPCQPPKWYAANGEQMKTNRSNSNEGQPRAGPFGNHKQRRPFTIGTSGVQPTTKGTFSSFRQPPGKGRIGGRQGVSGLSINASKTLLSSMPTSCASSTVPLKGESVDDAGNESFSDIREPKDIAGGAVRKLPGEQSQHSRGFRRSRSSSTKDTSSDSDSSDANHTNSNSAYSSADEASDSSGRQEPPRKTYDNAKRFQSVVVERRTKLTTVVLPKVKYGRPRRILLPRTSEVPITTVSMRGDFQFINPQYRSRLHNMSLPATVDSKHRVEDACIIGDVGVIGYTGEINQVSLLSFNKAGNKPSVCPLSPVSHNKQGISCLAPIPSSLEASEQYIEFLSGGFDKQIKRWRVVNELDPDGGESTLSVTVQPLPIEHNSTVTSIAWHGYDTTILSAAGTKLWTTHVERQSVLGSPSVLSNLINHVHAHPSNPHIVILEVAHPFSQVQVFDIRQGYTRKPVMSFGYSDTSASAKGIRARHRKGDTAVKYFVRGFDDGVVAIWDYRNIKTTLKVHRMEDPVYHTVFTKTAPVVWAFAGNQVDYIGPTDTR